MKYHAHQQLLTKLLTSNWLKRRAQPTGTIEREEEFLENFFTFKQIFEYFELWLSTKKEEWADKFKKCFQLWESLGYCTERNRWLRRLKQQTWDEVLHSVLIAFSVHSKSLCWKLDFTWVKEVLTAFYCSCQKGKHYCRIHQSSNSL